MKQTWYIGTDIMIQLYAFYYVSYYREGAVVVVVIVW